MLKPTCRLQMTEQLLFKPTSLVEMFSKENYEDEPQDTEFKE